MKVERISDRFDLVPFHPDCQRSLDGVDRDHQRLVSAARNQDSLKTLQGPAADTDALPDLEKFSAGTHEAPETSATIICQVASLDTGSVRRPLR